MRPIVADSCDDKSRLWISMSSIFTSINYYVETICSGNMKQEIVETSYMKFFWVILMINWAAYSSARWQIPFVELVFT